ncbi:ABC transporter substrate-binding protein [Brevibacterium marinum]|uniref:Iron complex transport system substrate-binding protein n=1 Tax=Brevibacterium marinum TaxID=418643 RepID=A0A846RVJ7_9MICO|nr:ABC transporter substrate-binding protein [Brevibacterium marinum]NJC55485.1 iron complex transport system substrate-binding protein [Brevibacterium marinum]
MKLNRITAAVIASVAGLGLLAGCSGGEGGDREGSGEAETRTVTDSSGAEIEVPAEPENVATLHYAATETLMDLDLPPVGQGAFQEPFVPEEWVEQLGDIPVVAQREPDLEQLAEVAPDLILAPNIYEPDTIEQMEEIAPVYQFTLRGGDRADWQQRVEEVADAVNQSGELEKLDADFEAEQKKIAAEHGDALEGAKLGVVSSFEDNSAYLWGSENMVGSLFRPLGFDWSDDEDAAIGEYADAAQGGNTSGIKEPEAQISMEVLDESLSDADIIFVTSDMRGEYDALTEKLLDSAVFEELPAVRAGHVYPHGKATIAGYSDARHGVEMARKAIGEYQKG